MLTTFGGRMGTRDAAISMIAVLLSMLYAVWTAVLPLSSPLTLLYPSLSRTPGRQAFEGIWDKVANLVKGAECEKYLTARLQASLRCSS